MLADDKVTPLPTLLERIGRRIDHAWQCISKSTDEWVEGSLELAQALSEARRQFPADQIFGRWLVDSKHDHVNKDDRAALIGLAGDLDLARKMLTETDRRSYQHIWNDVKDRFLHVKKPDKPKRGRLKGSKRGESKKFVRASEIVRPLIAADQDLKTAELEREHGISKDTFERAALAEQAALKATMEARQTATEEHGIAAGITEKGKIRLDEAIRIHKARLDKQFEQRVNDEVRRRIEAADDATRKRVKELASQNLTLQRIVTQRAVFSETQYRQMLMLCHPDSSASQELKAELLRVLVQNKIRLVGNGA